MKDLTKLKELLHEKLSLADIMVSYNVAFAYDPKLASEVQFKCPFHGKDNKPSARLYNDTNSCFCWVCRKSWDVVSFIMEKEALSYREAIKYLIGRYRVDTSSIPDTPTIDLKKDVGVSDSNVLMEKILGNLLELKKMKMPLEKYRTLCSVFCTMRYEKSRGVDVMESLRKIEGKVSSWLSKCMTF